jgi:predicted alpha/beta hydrolase
LGPELRFGTLPVRFAARDGYVLSGVLYEAVARPELAAVLCCGGGIPAAFYRRFAAWLASRGCPVLLFDYRGIGASRPASLRGFAARLEDWAEYDCAAAIDWLRERYPQACPAGIAHSIGGMVLAAAPSAVELRRFLFVAVHTGYWGDYHPRWRPLLRLLWHRTMPFLVRTLGYFPGRALRLGEDLPAGFASQWAGRDAPEIRVDSPRTAAGLERLSRLRGSALVLNFTDDAFATPAGTYRMLSHLPALHVEHRVIAPSDAKLPRIGHFGFFRAQAEKTLWEDAAHWLLSD